MSLSINMLSFVYKKWGNLNQNSTMYQSFSYISKKR